MNRWLRRVAISLAVLAALVALAWQPLVMQGEMPDDADFPLDPTRLRALAGSLPGARPVALRVEHVATFRFAQAMVVAGGPWQTALLPVYAWQLLYPDGSTIVIDSALTRAQARPESVIEMFDDAAAQRTAAALAQASQIHITHEHSDHIGGIAAHPQLAGLLPALRLTGAQLAEPSRRFPASLPEDLFASYRALEYDELLAVAPGVVLIKAPGHTPGTQMVYVELDQPRRELILLGDVAWHWRNVTLQRERPRFMTLLIRENRRAVFGQLKAIKRVHETEPALRLVPGHDGAVMKALLADGYVQAGFVDTPPRRD